MLIETIRDTVNDIEICVSCPTCDLFWYFDPRPGKHCSDCEKDRKANVIRVCPDCGPSPAIGDIRWLEIVPDATK